MPLLKLWNSLIGRPAAAKQTDAQPPSTVNAGPHAAAASSAGTRSAGTVSRSDSTSQSEAAGRHTEVGASVNASAGSAAQPTRSKKSAKQTKQKANAAPAVRLAPLADDSAAAVAKPVRQYSVVTRGEHAEICRLVVEAAPTSVLEIGVGDGSRADAVMQSLLAVSGDKSLRYAAIDQFEMVGGPIKLKDFHLRMRAIDVRPQVFPEPAPQGLLRFSRTVGFADVVIAAIPADQWNSSEVQSLVARITRPTSVVLCLSDGRWQRTVVHPPQTSKASKAA